MKHITLILLFIGTISFAQTDNANSPIFKFETTVIDYGTVKQGSDGNRTFVFTNIGKAPIIINSVSSSCGCTIPKKPLAPIMPGEKGEIEVHYDTNKVGPFQKNIYISSNAKPNKIEVSIKGRVVKKLD